MPTTTSATACAGGCERRYTERARPRCHRRKLRGGNGILYPAIAGDRRENAVMGFSISGPSMIPSAGYATLSSGQGNFGSPIIASRGRGPYFRRSTRWGDYSWAVLDRAAHRVWLANEYIPPRSSQTVDRHQNWGTRVYAVRLPSP